jgi:hypothetical protein
MFTRGSHYALLFLWHLAGVLHAVRVGSVVSTFFLPHMPANSTSHACQSYMQTRPSTHFLQPFTAPPGCHIFQSTRSQKKLKNLVLQHGSRSLHVASTGIWHQYNLDCSDCTTHIKMSPFCLYFVHTLHKYVSMLHTSLHLNAHAHARKKYKLFLLCLYAHAYVHKSIQLRSNARTRARINMLYVLACMHMQVHTSEDPWCAHTYTHMRVYITHERNICIRWSCEILLTKIESCTFTIREVCLHFDYHLPTYRHTHTHTHTNTHSGYHFIATKDGGLQHSFLQYMVGYNVSSVSRRRSSRMYSGCALQSKSRLVVYMSKICYMQ